MNETTVGALILLALFILYFMPTIISIKRGKRNTPAIVVVNLIFGWTLLGWMLAFIWAIKTDVVDVI